MIDIVKLLQFKEYFEYDFKETQKEYYSCERHVDNPNHYKHTNCGNDAEYQVETLTEYATMQRIKSAMKGIIK